MFKNIYTNEKQCNNFVINILKQQIFVTFFNGVGVFTLLRKIKVIYFF